MEIHLTTRPPVSEPYVLPTNPGAPEVEEVPKPVGGEEVVLEADAPD